MGGWAMRLLAALFAWVLFASYPAHAEKRVALVIGNAAYKNAATLQNPKNDAHEVSETLRRLGFETIVGLDLDEAGMNDKSIDFARAARDADVALVYYSGHAMQFGGVNYLMPTDAVLRDEADLRRLIRVDEIVADLSKAKNLRILVLDACRVNPLAEELSRSIEATRGPPVDRGLARIVASRGMIISYATQPGQTAADGRGRNSPYTTAFLKNIEASEEIGTVFRHMTADVYNETQGKQLPELSLSYIGDFYLKGRPTSEAGTQVAVVAPPTAPSVSSNPCGGSVLVSVSSRSPQPLSAAEECTLKPKDVFKECDKCPEMVVIPAGGFTMGSPITEKDRHDNEGPQHAVTIAKRFTVGKYDVTFAEWDACVDAGACPSALDSGFGRGDRPVINVSWDEAKLYAAWLVRITGKEYRLLTEAEWEYAARSGSTTRFFFGEDEKEIDQYAWYGDYFSGYFSGTQKVGGKKPNAFELYDMVGNVWQWVEDCWRDNYRGAPSDGSGWTSRVCSSRVVRGGSWYGMNPSDVRSARRDGDPFNYQRNYLGFRVARTLSPSALDLTASVGIGLISPAKNP
jgi:formylglycine-generating enzyme required for sulfatase activity